jgi:hypothetical protein
MAASGKLTFTTSPAARSWMIAFCIGVAFSAIAARYFPDRMPWSEDLPRATQAGLRLFAGITLGLLLQAAWWVVRRTAHHT